MPELTLRDLPPKLVEEIEEWARLRRLTPERAAVELVRNSVADRDRQALSAGEKRPH